LPEEELGPARTEEAKRLTGKEEAETVEVEVAVAADCLPCVPRLFSAATAVGISKTARHTGHFKGGWSICSTQKGEEG